MMRLKKISLITACAIGLTLGACSFSSEGDGAVPEPAIEPPDMNAYWAAHAAHRQRGDLDAATAILAEDCVLYQPFQTPISGRQNIVPKFKAALEAATIEDVSFRSQEVYHQGASLVDFGTFSETFMLDGNADRHVVEGDYVAVLERDSAGDWKVKRYMAMPATPLPPG